MVVRHSLALEVFDVRESVLARGFLAKNYSIALHDHDFYEINIVMSGSGTHLIEGNSFAAARGDVFVIPPGIVHGYNSASEDFNVYHLICKVGFFRRFEGELESFRGFRLLFEVEPYLRRQNKKAALSLTLCELSLISGQLELYEAMRGDRSECGDAVRALHALTLIGYLSGLMADGARAAALKEDGDKRGIMRAMEYVGSNLSGKLTVDILASVALMSRATFIRKFSAVCNTSPHEYVIRERVKEARRLLSLGRGRAESAQAAGFFDVSHMERTLRKYPVREQGRI